MNLKTAALCFSVDGKHFENDDFRKQRHRYKQEIFLLKFS